MTGSQLLLKPNHQRMQSTILTAGMKSLNDTGLFCYQVLSSTLTHLTAKWWQPVSLLPTSNVGGGRRIKYWGKYNSQNTKLKNFCWLHVQVLLKSLKIRLEEKPSPQTLPFNLNFDLHSGENEYFCLSRKVALLFLGIFRKENTR